MVSLNVPLSSVHKLHCVRNCSMLFVLQCVHGLADDYLVSVYKVEFKCGLFIVYIMFGRL